MYLIPINQLALPRWNNKSWIRTYLVFTFLQITMKSLRLSLLFILWVTLLSATGYAQSSTGGVTLETTLEISKNTAIASLDTTYSQLQQTYVANNNTNTMAHLQALSCLEIVDFPGYEEYLSEKKNELRNEILEEYIQHKMQLERRKNGLPVNESTLTSGIESFATIYNARIEQLKNNVDQRIQTVEQEVQAYGQQNNELLNDVSQKIQQLKQIQDKQQGLENQVFEFNNLYLRHEANLLDVINQQKNTLQSTLREQIQSLIQRDQERFGSFIGYAQALQAKQDAQIRLFSVDFDEAVQWIVWDRYNPSVYQRLQDQLATVNETFYVDRKLNCQSLLTTSLDVDGYLQSISSSIQDLEEWLEQWVQALSETWAADAFKWSVFTALQEFYTNRTQELFNEFRTFKNEQFGLRSSRIVAQRTKVQELQEMRSRYTQASWTEKESLRTQLVSQAQSLRQEASAHDIKTNLESLLNDLWVSLELEVNEDDDQELLESSNPFVSSLHQLARKLQRTNQEFAQVLWNAIPNLESKWETASEARKTQIETLIQAIELYVQAYE